VEWGAAWQLGEDEEFPCRLPDSTGAKGASRAGSKAAFMSASLLLFHVRLGNRTTAKGLFPATNPCVTLACAHVARPWHGRPSLPVFIAALIDVLP
jgi:hypothetical protein